MASLVYQQNHKHFIQFFQVSIKNALAAKEVWLRKAKLTGTLSRALKFEHNGDKIKEKDDDGENEEQSNGTLAD
jgi:hypothetical protein